MKQTFFCKAFRSWALSDTDQYCNNEKINLLFLVVPNLFLIQISQEKTIFSTVIETFEALFFQNQKKTMFETNPIL